MNTYSLHYPLNSLGGCGRPSPNGIDMLSFTVTAVTDAFNMVAAVQFEITSYGFDTPESKRLRALLFLFFGITFDDENQVTADTIQNYNYVSGTGSPPEDCHAQPETKTSLISYAGVFGRIQSLLQAPRPVKAERPWLHCLEDYSFFTEHLVGSDGLENQSAPLAAEYYNYRRELPSASSRLKR